MEKINIIEKTILEALSRSKKTEKEIYHEVKISNAILQSALMNLLIKGIVVKDILHYRINSSMPEQYKRNLQSQLEKIKTQKFLVSEAIQIDDTHFEFFKFSLNEEDEKLLKAMLSNIKEFLTERSRSKCDSKAGMKESILFLGRQRYEKVLNHLIS